MFCLLTLVLFLDLPTILPVRMNPVEEGTEPHAHLYPPTAHLPYIPRRLPIFFTAIPECYFVLSDIRLKMSFLLLFKHLNETETLAAERLRVLCTHFALWWIVECFELQALALVC